MAQNFAPRKVIGVGERGHVMGARAAPHPPKKQENIFSGNVKFGHFSGKYHVKFGNFVNISCKYYKEIRLFC